MILICLRVYVCVCVLQSYTASVREGSSPTFKWTVDDKPYFTYYNTVLNVIYQHAAVYKLTVSFCRTFTVNMSQDQSVSLMNCLLCCVPACKKIICCVTGLFF